jgi:outer membrane receptor protein involved in Fe transport
VLAAAPDPCLEGRVVDASGAPIGGARISVSNHHGTPVQETVVEPAGTFRICGLPTGSYHLGVSASGFAPSEQSLQVGNAAGIVRIMLAVEPVHAQVTVSATRGSVENVVTAPQLVTVQDKEQFRDHPMVNLGAVLAANPGTMVQETTYGQVSPHLRGLTGYQTLFLIDGIRFNTSTFRAGPNQYLAYIQPSQVETVETILGPAGATYGSDSLGGTIDVLTLDPRFGSDAKWEVHGDVNAMGSTADLSGMSSALVSVGNKRISETFGASGQRVNDLRAGGGLDSRNVFTRYFGLSPNQLQDLEGDRLRETAFSQYGVHSKLAVRPAADQSLTFWYQRSELMGVRQYREQRGGPGRLQSRTDPQSLDFLYARYEKLNVGLLDSVSGTFSLNRQVDGFVRQGLRFTDPIQTDYFRVNSLGYSGQGTTHLGSRQALVFGGEIYDEHIDSTRFFFDPVRSLRTQDRAQYPNGSLYRTSGLFVQNTSELVPGRLRAVLGTRFTSIGFHSFADRNLNAQGRPLGVVDASRSFNDLTFNASLAWQVTQHLGVHALVGRGFRAPNLNDIGSIGVTTLGYDIPVEAAIAAGALMGADSSEGSASTGKLARRLGAERLFNYELGVRFDSRKLYARVHLFDAELLDPIVGRTLLFPADQVPTAIAGTAVTPIAPSAIQQQQGVVAVQTALSPRAVKTSVNDGHTRYYGIESLVRYSFSSRLVAQGNYTYLTGHELYPNRPLRRLPPQMGYLSLRYVPSRPNLWLELAGRFAGAQTRLNGADIDDDRIGASRRRRDIADFFRGGIAGNYIDAGADGTLGNADDIFSPTGESLRQIQDRVLPLGATIQGVTVANDGTRVPLFLRTDGWFSLDLRGGVPVGERLSFLFGVLNMMDTNYRVHGSGVDSPGISGFVGVRYIF